MEAADYAGVPRFSSSFRTDPSRRRAQNRLFRQRDANRSFIDREVLERSTDAVLSIVHPGKSEQQKQLREQQRERIRDHVLQTMKPRSSLVAPKMHYTTQCLMETKEEMAERRRKREVPSDLPNKKAKCLIEQYSDQLHQKTKVSKEAVGGFHFSFDPPADIISNQFGRKENLRQKPPIKHVSFVSPEKEILQNASSPVTSSPAQFMPHERFPVQSFRTPVRPLQKDVFSKPPPLLKPKRKDIVIGHCSSASQKTHKTLPHRQHQEERKSSYAENGLKIGETKDEIADFERELNASLLEIPDSEPYDLLGIGTSSVSKRFENQSFF